MELDDIRQAWTEVSLRQEGMEALLRMDYRDRRVQRTRAALRWSLAGRVLALLAWMAFTAWAGSFWVAYRHVPHWLVIGLLLHAYGIAGIWSSATQLLLLARIFLFDAPVLVLQRRLAQLRRFRAWSTFLLGLPWWCLWLLLPLAALYRWTGVDGLAGNVAWVWACMALGVAGMAASLWLARRLAGRAQHAPWLQRIIDDMSGCNLRRASHEMEQLARFERE